MTSNHSASAEPPVEEATAAGDTLQTLSTVLSGDGAGFPRVPAIEEAAVVLV